MFVHGGLYGLGSDEGWGTVSQILQHRNGFINGQPHNAAEAAFDRLDKDAAYALYGVGAGFIRRFAALHIGGNFFRTQGLENDAVGLDAVFRIAAIMNADGSQDGMPFAGQSV